MTPDDTCSPLTDLLDKLESFAIEYGHECPDPDDLRKINETKAAIVKLFASVGSALEIARGSLSETQELLETERLRLAACSTAALGYFDGCHEDYKSAALGDVLDVRKRLEEHARKLRESTDYAVSLREGWNAFWKALVSGSHGDYDAPTDCYSFTGSDLHKLSAAMEAVVRAERGHEIGQSPTALLSGGPEFNGVLPQRIPAVGIPYIVREPSGQCWGPFPSDKAALAWAEKAGIETCDFDDVMSPYPVPSQGKRSATDESVGAALDRAVEAVRPIVERERESGYPTPETMDMAFKAVQVRYSEILTAAREAGKLPYDPAFNPLFDAIYGAEPVFAAAANPGTAQDSKSDGPEA